MKQRKLVISVLMVLAASLLPLRALSDSQARIVRLSQAEGDVEIDRGQGFEQAVLNLPVTEGAKVRTGYDGYAEVEFEDSSTIRITPGSLVEFRLLALRDSGNRASTVNVVKGTTYLSYLAGKDDEFLLTFGNEKLRLTKAAHIRLEMGLNEARVSVFNGSAVQVEGPLGSVEISKKQSVTFAMNDGDQTPPTAPAKLTKIPSDAWEKRQEDYQEHYSKNGVYRNSPYAFGMSDLNYFGRFIDAGVCGMAWRPFFATAAWDPFAAGGWAWYPGYGYSWVSAYPWGWTPYHYGSWQMCPGYGWAWQPGGLWTSICNAPNPQLYPHNPHIIPPPPPPSAPPVSGRAGLPPDRGLHSVPLPSTGLMIIRKDSAGLGIARGSIPNMHQVSQQFEHRGSAAEIIYSQGGAGPINTRSTAGMHQGSSASLSSQTGSSQTGFSQTGSSPRSAPVSSPHSIGGMMSPMGGSQSAPASSSSSRPSGGAPTTPR